MKINYKLLQKNLYLTIAVFVLVGVIVGSALGAALSVTAKGLLPWLESTPLGQTANSLFGRMATPPVSAPSSVVVSQTEEESATISTVEKASSSVVSIVITKDLSKLRQPRFYNPFADDPFFKQFGFDFSPPETTPVPQGKKEIGGGTGFVVNSEEGYILTNKHVVSDGEAEYTVVANDGQRYPAKVVATDPVNDLAVVRVANKKLPALTLGDSDKLKLGQTVIAIGNALGEFRNTVTKGVVSGLSRSVTASDNSGSSERLEGVIQTDAAINPGNSGGPLLNLNGEVIGINTAVSQAGQLISFAIPVNLAKQVIASVAQYGRVVRPFLGVRYTVITEAVAEKLQLGVDYGALIVRGDTVQDLAVTPGSPADKAGLKENDIILEVDGEQLNDNRSLSGIIQKHQPGDKVVMKVLSKGVEQTVTVTLSELKTK